MRREALTAVTPLAGDVQCGQVGDAPFLDSPEGLIINQCAVVDLVNADLDGASTLYYTGEGQLGDVQTSGDSEIKKK